VTKLLINLLIVFLLISCQLQKDHKLSKLIDDKKNIIIKTTVSESQTTDSESNNTVSKKKYHCFRKYKVRKKAKYT